MEGERRIPSRDYLEKEALGWKKPKEQGRDD